MLTNAELQRLPNLCISPSQYQGSSTTTNVLHFQTLLETEVPITLAMICQELEQLKLSPPVMLLTLSL
uniref:Uncharacterized protein n=1 Tax=Brassica oleracea TaxID=3712 RepID=A0A3P6AXX1_BRAOL|nr:unnamed protein product [Brassica oleracea]